MRKVKKSMSMKEKFDEMRAHLNRSLYQEVCSQVEKKTENDGNHPSDFETLTDMQQYCLLYWIEHVILYARNYARRSSYGVKHDFEHEAFYITNGQFKGAMLLLGYMPKECQELNWVFRMRPLVKRRASDPDYDPLNERRYRLGWFDKEFACILHSAGYLEVLMEKQS